MKSLISVLAAGLLLASLTASAAAQASSTQEPVALSFYDQLTFGGGAHFDFSIPVHGTGFISVQINLPPGTPVEAMLFSPRSHNYAAKAGGTGSLFLSHTIDETEGRDTEEDWRLDVVLASEMGDVVGTLRVNWPGGGNGNKPVTWINAGPTNPDDLARVSNGLSQLQARARGSDGVPPLDADATRMIGAVRTRLDVLSGTPAGQVQNDYAANDIKGVPVNLNASGGPLTVSLTHFAVHQQGHWVAENGSNRSYVVAATLPEAGAAAVGGRSRLYRFMSPDPYVYNSRAMEVGRGMGEALLLSTEENIPSGEVLLAVIEGEHAGGATSLHEFLHGAELFAAYRAAAGPDAIRQLPWLMDVALGRGDGIVGTPQLVVIERNAIGDTRVDRDLGFAQAGASYDVQVRFAVANRTK